MMTKESVLNITNMTKTIKRKLEINEDGEDINDIPSKTLESRQRPAKPNVIITKETVNFNQFTLSNAIKLKSTPI